MIRTCVLALLGAWLCLAGPAFAANNANKEKAKVLYRSGMQHYNLGEHEQALEDFKAAYREYEDASFLFNIAQCQRALGKKEDAVRSYRSFVRESKQLSVETRAKVEEIVAALEASIRDEQDTKARLDAANAAAATEAKPAVVEAPVAVVSAPPPPPKKPVYKRWWLWTAVGGGVAAIALGVGLGVGLSSRTTTYPSPPTSPAGGTIQF